MAEKNDERSLASEAASNWCVPTREPSRDSVPGPLTLLLGVWWGVEGDALGEAGAGEGERLGDDGGASMAASLTKYAAKSERSTEPCSRVPVLSITGTA